MYEWEQSLEEVNLYIEPPRGLKAEQIECTITPRHLRLGIKGNPPFIDVGLCPRRGVHSSFPLAINDHILNVPLDLLDHG